MEKSLLGWSFLGSAAVPSSGLSLNFSRFEINASPGAYKFRSLSWESSQVWPLLLWVIALPCREHSSVGAKAVCG